MTAKPANFFEAQVCAHLQTLRGQAVILDSDLAWFLGLQPQEIIAAVEKHPEGFPDDFVFHLTNDELAELRGKSMVLTETGLVPGQRRMAFTTHGAAMLLTVFRTGSFAVASIPVLRAFANYWAANEIPGQEMPLVNRKS